ncbi:MAG: serine hydrolase [Planctomycetota bacterium]|nr:serine hydrolase [Planctomycetota bacterium]
MKRLLLAVIFAVACSGASRLVAQDEGQGPRLASAIIEGNLDAVEKLIEKGLDVNAPLTEGLWALDVARLCGRKSIEKLLLEKGAKKANAKIVPPGTLAPDLADLYLSSAISKDSPGFSVIVSRKGRELFCRGYGRARVKAGVPAGPGTPFRIGSVTKQFTSVAILKLQEDGKLKVSDRLSKFFPDFPRGGEVTLHHLLSHTSGIHSYTSDPGFLKGVTKPVKAADLVEKISKAPFDFDPGRHLNYSNSGYFLLGLIVEKASGQTYGEYLQEKFFKPLGMKNTGVHRRGSEPAGEAYGYTRKESGYRRAVNWDMSWAGGAGALYSTVRDLDRWNEGLFALKVLNRKSLELALTPVKPIGKGDKVFYAYGLIISPHRGLRQVAHSGGLHGFQSYLARYPGQNLTVAVLANAEFSPGAMAENIAELWLAAEMEPRLEREEKKAIAGKGYDDYPGRYDYGSGVMTIEREGDRLFAQLGLQPRFEIFPAGDDEFFWKVVEARAKFERAKSGKVTGILHSQGGGEIKAPRLARQVVVKVDPALYDAYLGRYDYGGGQVLTVTRDGGKLMGQLTGQPKLLLLPRSKTEFFFRVVNAEVAFVSDPKGKVIGVEHLQNGRTLEAPRLK